VILGEDELARKELSVKPLRSQGVQASLPLNEAIELIRG